MRLVVLAWLAVLGAAFALAGSCAIDHRSGSFECVKSSDCVLPRVCSDGLCVIPGGTVDAPPGRDAAIDDGPVDSKGCPDQCTSCDPDKKQCVIDCGAGGNCAGPVTCPAGWNCDIRCNTFNACSQGINCQQGESCAIACTGRQSCQKVVCGDGPCTLGCNGRDSCIGVTCGSDRCSVACVGQNACRDVKCGMACACDVTCEQQASCDAVACKPFCGAIGRGCTSQTFGCDSCQP